MKHTEYDGKKLSLLRTGREFAVILVAVILLFRFVIGVSAVSGNSMLPALDSGKLVIYNRLQLHYERGDIASVKMPSGEYLVKRVVAVAGDTVDVRDGKLYINGDDSLDIWGSGKTLPQGKAVKYPLTLSYGQIFVMGDNRPVSIDSRTIGPVSTTQTRGKIFIVHK